MKLYIVLIGVIIGSCSLAPVQECSTQPDSLFTADLVDNILAKDSDSLSNAKYSRLLNDFLHDSSMTVSDLILLQVLYTQSDGYNPYGDVMSQRSMYSFNDDGKYQETLVLWGNLMNTNPVSLLGNREAGYAYKELGDLVESEKYMQRFSKLCHALTSLGDGTNMPCAIFVPNPLDGQTIIKFYWGYKLGREMSSAFDEDGRFYDVLSANGPNLVANKMFYFYIEPAMASNPLETSNKSFNLTHPKR